MQKRKRHTYPHTRRFALALIITMGFMLYLIFYNPYPIIAIPPYFEFLPFIYLPLTLWWLPLGFRYLRRYQIQKRIILLMVGCLMISFSLSATYSILYYPITCSNSSQGHWCYKHTGCASLGFDIITFENFPAGLYQDSDVYGAGLYCLF